MEVLKQFSADFISPSHEMGAYEFLWEEKIKSTSGIVKYLANENTRRPSEVVPSDIAVVKFQQALNLLKESGVGRFGTRVIGTIDFPEFMADDPISVPFLYFMGYWDLVFSQKKVAVIGTRKPSNDGILRTRRLVKWLVEKEVTVISGLAKGIDTVAHKTTLEQGGRTIAVIGTPITSFYPRENIELQKIIMKDHLLISHVPIIKHSKNKNPIYNRFFFPERNRIMSAISDASIIVEAGQTSGTRTQARAALQQGRKLIMLENVFKRGLTWPEKLLEKGAYRVTDFDQLQEVLYDKNELTKN